MTCYTQKNNQGLLNISDNVFNQIAKSTLDELLKNDLKGLFSLKNGKKTCKILTTIDKKNHIQVNIEVYLMTGCDANSVTNRIQKEVYDDIYDVCEISSVKVNVIVLSFLNEKA